MTSLAPRSFACATLTVAGLAQAAGLPVLESKLQVRAVDAKSGAAIPSAWVVAHESFYTGWEASGTECFRAIVAATDAHGEATPTLPATRISSPHYKTGSTRHVELFAYRPGYCAAQPYASADWAGFIKWANKNDPGGLWGKVKSPDPGEDLSIRMMPSVDPPEHRLRHLKLAAAIISGSCYPFDATYLAPLRAAVLSEASSIATTPFEKFLAAQLEAAFEHDAGTPAKKLWMPFHGLASSGDVKMLRMLLDQRHKDPTLRAPIRIASGYANTTGKTMTIGLAPNHVALPTPPQVDDRDESGLTALMHGARAMQPAAVSMLLDEGADVRVLSGVGGYSALDLVLSRAGDDVHENGTQGQEIHLLRMIELLAAAQPAPTIHPRYRAELSDPARWTIPPHLREFWMQVRALVMPLAERAVVTTSCPIVEVARSTLDLTSVKAAR